MTRLLFILPLLLLAPTAYSQLLINEVMSVNEGTVTDEQGEQEDWIEIYNAGNSPVDLGGFYLSDDPLELQKYEIPTTQANLTIIPAKGFLLLWADKDTEQGINHLDFKLSNGETLFLVDAAGNVISSITPPTLLGDESYGRLQDGGSEWQIFSQTASPLASNNDPTRAEVFFSKNTQLFTNTITVELSANNTNGQIRYTTDGTIPIATSSLYTTSLTFTTNIDLKATFFFNAGGASHTTSARYVKMESDLANFSSDLPLIVIHTDDQVLNGSEMKNTFWSVIEPNNNGRAHGNDPASFSGKVAMRIRGATSAGFPKKQWRCELRNEDDSDLKTELLGMPAESDWVLYAPGRYDRALINNALMYEMSNRLGTYAPRTRFVEVYYNQDGVLDQNDYWGIYILTEKIKIDENRVDIDKPDVTNDKLNTFIVRYDRDNLFTTTYTQNNYAAWTRYYDIKDPDPAGLSTTQINNVAAEFELFENKLAATDLSYRQYVDMHSFVNSHILKALTREPDGFCVSYFLFKDNNGLINSGPIWDFDRAINSTDTRSASPLDWGAGNARYWNPDNPYRSIHINELVKDPLYRTKFYDAWFDWRENNILNTNQLNTLIDSMATVLAEAQVRNFNRWNTAEYAPRYGGFQGEINAMKDWFATRSEWMDGQLLNPPTFSPDGGTVTANQNITITNTIGTGTIYYTTDGTDPMLADGTLAPNAQIYSGTLRVSNRGMNTITARIKTDTDWGAIARQHFYIQANYSGLLINEIHYAPKDSILSNDTIASKNFSFVEVVNTTQEQLSLVGTRFTKGIDLTIEKILLIEPGGYVVFAEDEDWFEARYGFAPDGQFSGMLDPDGEELILEDPFGNVLDNVRFNDKNPWMKYLLKQVFP